MDLKSSMAISASGMRAQSMRMRVIAENLANKDSLAPIDGTDPYRRKVVSFGTELDRELGVEKVKVAGVSADPSKFGQRYEPGHPAADENGYVKTPNVNGLMEMFDMRQASRSYQANLNAIEASKKMMLRTIELLR